jgi:cytochrome b
MGIQQMQAAGSVSLPATVRVWDPLVRIFHWSLVAGMAYEFIFEPGTLVHNTLGQVLLGLIALRVIWGFVGTRHARFSDFVRGPLAVVGYCKDIITGHPKRYLGHNPAGGIMVLALLASITMTAASGWLMITDALWGEEWIEEFHEAVAWLTLALIIAHVAGVVLASLQHRENLVRSMVTGRKQV